MGNSVCSCKDNIPEQKNELDARINKMAYKNKGLDCCPSIGPDPGQSIKNQAIRLNTEHELQQFSENKEQTYDERNRKLHENSGLKKRDECIEGEMKINENQIINADNGICEMSPEKFKNNLSALQNPNDNKKQDYSLSEFNSIGNSKLITPYGEKEKMDRNQMQERHLEIEGEKIDFQGHTNEEHPEEVVNAIHALENIEPGKNHKKSYTPSPELSGHGAKFADNVSTHRIFTTIFKNHRNKEDIRK